MDNQKEIHIKVFAIKLLQHLDYDYIYSQGIASVTLNEMLLSKWMSEDFTLDDVPYPSKSIVYS